MYLNLSEIALFGSAFYSKYEKIDECYAKRKAPTISENTNEDELKRLVSGLCSTLEEVSPITEEWHSALQ